MKEFVINHRKIGASAPVFIIAEAGVNHNGDMEMARQLIDEAARAGADAVKFQSYRTEELATPHAPKAAYQKQTTAESESQYEMLKRLELSRENHFRLMEHCERRRILFLSTPYDEPSVDLLDQIGVEAIKISSSDVTHLPFLRYVAQKCRPVLLSTGMSGLGEVEEAVATLQGGGLYEIALLHCTSEYPAPVEESNLCAIKTLRQAFGYPVGFSDHTTGIEVSAWAVAVGACMIEKHFTLDRALPGPDHEASLEPAELQQLVARIRQMEKALGDGIKRPMPSELLNKNLVQKGLVARRDIAPGEVIRADALACKRPVRGLKPRDWDLIVGKTAARAITADEPIRHDAILWERTKENE